jgi:hypothetical protein
MRQPRKQQYMAILRLTFAVNPSQSFLVGHKFTRVYFSDFQYFTPAAFDRSYYEFIIQSL